MWTWFLEAFPTSASRLDCVDAWSFRPGCVSTRRPFRQTKWPPRRFEAWNLHFTHFAQGAPLFSPHEPQLEPEREKKTIPVTLQFALWASTQTNKKNKKTTRHKKSFTLLPSASAPPQPWSTAGRTPWTTGLQNKREILTVSRVCLLGQ